MVSFNVWDLLFQEYIDGKSCYAIMLVDYQDLENWLDCIAIVTESDQDNDDV